VIGLTIVAIGTSLPELAASVVSAYKGESDIALGNVIGSNMFNILGVMGVPALLHPGALEPAVMSRDFPIMIFLSVLLFLMAARRGGSRRITRAEGVILLTGFVAYQTLLFVSS
jgi:cation:H+ antiporter